MKKLFFIALLAISMAACTSYEAKTEHLTFLGATIGMPKQQALDSLRAYDIDMPAFFLFDSGEYDSTQTNYLCVLEDKYAYYYTDFMRISDWGGNARFIFHDDTLRSVLLYAEVTSTPDINSLINSAMFGKYQFEQQPTGEYVSRITYNGTPLAELDTIHRTDYWEEEDHIYIAVSIGSKVTGDAPIIKPTDEQLTVGHSSGIILGGDEYDTKKQLSKLHGKSLFGDDIIMMYPDAFVENIRWAYATYTFRDDKLWLVSLDSKEMTKPQAETLLQSIVTSSRIADKYGFHAHTDMYGNAKYVSDVQYFSLGTTGFDTDNILAGGSYQPLVEAYVSNKDGRYNVEVHYQYNN